MATDPCLVCKRTPTDRCHIKSKGSGGPDELWNIIPLCRFHHIESHQAGWRTFCERYFAVRVALWERGWRFNEFGKIIRH